MNAAESGDGTTQAAFAIDACLGAMLVGFSSVLAAFGSVTGQNDSRRVGVHAPNAAKIDRDVDGILLDVHEFYDDGVIGLYEGRRRKCRSWSDRGTRGLSR